VKRYGKYRRKLSWIVKRYENYGRKVSLIWKLNQWDDRIQYPEQQQQPYTRTSEQRRWNSTQNTLLTKTKRNTLWKYPTLTLSMTKLQQVNKIVIKMLNKHEN
jgi:hypothetical protein